MDKVQEIMDLVGEYGSMVKCEQFDECEDIYSEIESKLRALLEQQKKDSTDAECFRWWVHEAAANPALVAKAIAHCITEDEYRAVIVGAKVAKDAAIKAATKGA